MGLGTDPSSGLANIFLGISGIVFHLFTAPLMEKVKLAVINLSTILVGLLQIAVTPISLVFKPFQVMFAFFLAMLEQENPEGMTPQMKGYERIIRRRQIDKEEA